MALKSRKRRCLTQVFRNLENVAFCPVPARPQISRTTISKGNCSPFLLVCGSTMRQCDKMSQINPFLLCGFACDQARGGSPLPMCHCCCSHLHCPSQYLAEKNMCFKRLVNACVLVSGSLTVGNKVMLINILKLDVREELCRLTTQSYLLRYNSGTEFHCLNRLSCIQQKMVCISPADFYPSVLFLLAIL